jgi:hypothetical protein
MMLSRLVAVEALDHLDKDDPAARHSRRDLVRIHHAMGTRTAVARSWQQLLPKKRTAPLKILELGAGDGTLLLGVARSLRPAWPQVQLTLLDQQDLVSRATLKGYADLGWKVKVEVADALEWATRTTASAPGTPAWNLISTSLFLHHFKDQQLRTLLASIASRTNRFFACEPRRGRLALVGSHLVGLIGANAVTREDAVLSVRAGFCATEITAHWPQGKGAWQCRESPAGLFSHCFSAHRTRAE